MAAHAEFLPRFILQIRKEEPAQSCYLLACRVIGEETGFLPTERVFESFAELSKAFRVAGISEVRWGPALQEMEKLNTASLEVNLNEALRLSVIHTDSTE